MLIFVSPKILKSLKMEGILAFPLEACGFLLGERKDEGLTLRGLVPGKASRPEGYLLSADELMAAEKIAYNASQEVLGFYHSHPGGEAIPSESDHADALPGYVYAIVSVRAKKSEDLAFYRLDEKSGRLALLRSINNHPGSPTKIVNQSRQTK
jgi:proteasome lid subunit RPN8/RPN11